MVESNSSAEVDSGYEAAASVRAGVDALLNDLFPLKPMAAVAHARLMRKTRALYDASPDSGLPFVDRVVGWAKDGRGYSRSAVFEALRRGDLSDEVLDAVEGTRFETIGHLNKLRRLAPQYQMAYLTGAPVEGLAPSAQPVVEDWWATLPGFIETADRFCVPGVCDLWHGDSKVIIPQLTVVDLITVDPPYGVNRVDARGRRIAGDEDPHTISSWLVPAMLAVLKPDSFAFVCTSRRVEPVWMAEASPLKLDYVTWLKGAPSALGDSSSTFNSDSEDLLVIHKGKPKLRSWVNHPQYGFSDWPTGQVVKRDNASWPIDAPRGHGPDQNHPTRKPVGLGRRMMLNGSDEGDLVLDPCMGTGPFAVAAVELRRRFVGIELEADWFAIAVDRVKDALRKTLSGQS